MLTAVLMLASCGVTTPYDEYDRNGYTVSVKYDANGGMFTTNTEIIVDTYSLSSLPTDASGNKQLALIAPEDSVRGSGNSFNAINSGYFLAGWYTERTPVLDENGNHLDHLGNIAEVSGKAPAYTYSGKWDFENGRYKLSGDTFTASEPVLTLYAAWVPEFSFTFYRSDTGAEIGTHVIDPRYGTSITVPAYSETSGKMEMYDFPTVTGMTFDKVSASVGGEAIVGSLTHTGIFDEATGTASDTDMKLYVDFIEGEWFQIYTAEQFIENASVSASFILMNDLDFTGLTWKSSLMYGKYTGKIVGNGHTIKNVTLRQTNQAKTYAGLFGQLAEGAEIADVVFDNISFEIERGSRLNGVAYGLLAGSAADLALRNVTVKNSTLRINSGCIFPEKQENYSIGLLFGMGNVGSTDLSGITCVASGESPDKVTIEISGNTVIAHIAN